jgi:pimeloyl-ACP methyl ester carboxylesterase
MAATVGSETLVRQTDLALSRSDSRAHLTSLVMPSLVLAGLDDALCPPDVQREMAAALPDAVLALIPDAGHFAPLERPLAVARHVAAWLARVDDVTRRKTILVTQSLEQEDL